MRSTSVHVTELVEAATGQRYSVRRQRAPDQSFGRRFTVIFDDTAYELAARLSGNATRVLFALPKRLDFRTWKRLPQSELAEHLGLSRSAVSRSMRELEKHQLVASRGKGVALEWRIARVIGYRGTPGQYHADERNDRVSQAQPLPQPALPLGPSRAIRGGRKTPVKPNISQEPPHLHAV